MIALLALHGIAHAATDSDFDGLPDIEELELGTDPFAWDSDGGGVSDGLEVSRGTNPMSAADDFSCAQCTNDDTDGDGLDDASELFSGFVLDPDSDGDNDGLDDAFEVLNGTHAGRFDTDGGGRGDGSELSCGSSPLTSVDDWFCGSDSDGDYLYDTDETLLGTDSACIGPASDCDADGYPDYVEAQNRTNPALADAPSCVDADGDGACAFVDCDDGDANAVPGNGGLSEPYYDGIDQDCDGRDIYFGSVDLFAGQIVVSEIFPQSTAFDDADAEWFEVANTHYEAVDLFGLDITSGTGEHWSIDEHIVLNAFDVLVLAGSTDTGLNGGVDAAAAWSGALSLGDTADTLILSVGAVLEVDEITWDATWPLVPGSSLAVDPNRTTAALNDDPANYCVPTDTFAGGTGSPDRFNSVCLCEPEFDLGSAVGEDVAALVDGVGNTCGRFDDFDGACAFSYAHDVAFRWVAPADGSYRIDTRGSLFDTVLSVREPCTDLFLIECNDDTFGLRSRVFLDAVAGEEYLIVVDGFGSNCGLYQLNITAPCAPGDTAQDCLDTAVTNDTGLFACAPDAFEPDDTQATATNTTSATDLTASLPTDTGSTSDTDWFTFQIASGATMHASTFLSEGNGSFLVTLYDADGDVLVASSDSVQLTNGTPSTQRYWAQVELVSGDPCVVYDFLVWDDFGDSGLQGDLGVLDTDLNSTADTSPEPTAETGLIIVLPPTGDTAPEVTGDTGGDADTDADADSDADADTDADSDADADADSDTDADADADADTDADADSDADSDVDVDVDVDTDADADTDPDTDEEEENKSGCDCNSKTGEANGIGFLALLAGLAWGRRRSARR
ncbi:MAG: hypothetical protein R3F61_28485 [Myxococcota bacterium]